jgi:hypothetical protein
MTTNSMEQSSKELQFTSICVEFVISAHADIIFRTTAKDIGDKAS